jgi:hypothetical protein
LSITYYIIFFGNFFSFYSKKTLEKILVFESFGNRALRKERRNSFSQSIGFWCDEQKNSFYEWWFFCFHSIFSKYKIFLLQCLDIPFSWRWKSFQGITLIKFDNIRFLENIWFIGFLCFISFWYQLTQLGLLLKI